MDYRPLKVITTQHIDRVLENPKWVEQVSWIKTVDQAKKAIQRMPGGKKGLVIGSGSNTTSWKSKGWQTLDIDPKFNPNYVHDANDLRNLTPRHDFILAERLEGEGTERGISWDNFLTNANFHLNKEGILIIDTVNQPKN